MSQQVSAYLYVDQRGAHLWTPVPDDEVGGYWAAGIAVGQCRCQSCDAPLGDLGQWESPTQEYIKLECQYCGSACYRVRQLGDPRRFTGGTTVINTGSGVVVQGGGAAASNGGIAVGGSISGPIVVRTETHWRGR